MTDDLQAILMQVAKDAREAERARLQCKNKEWRDRNRDRIREQDRARYQLHYKNDSDYQSRNRARAGEYYRQKMLDPEWREKERLRSLDKSRRYRARKKAEREQNQ